MNTIEKVLKYIKKRGSASGKEIADALGFSRQAINKHLKKLVQQNMVMKTGSTKSAKYTITSAVSKILQVQKLKRKFDLADLEEDQVFNKIAQSLNLKKYLIENVFEIFSFAFTEMLNNAIDHSQSEGCVVEITLDPYRCSFRIRDFGIGIFYSIFTKFNLSDEAAAIGEIVKGKRTTMPERHTGEGIFFTSKSGDTIIFRSHKTAIIFDNTKRDIFIEEKKFIKGTEVTFGINRHSKRKLAAVFSQYAPEEFDYNFEKTRVSVKLQQGQYISRSEAKRLLAGLDRFKVIVLDFKDVRSLGQGFADEIFRVFNKNHPDITITTENLSPTLKPMIQNVVDN